MSSPIKCQAEARPLDVPIILNKNHALKSEKKAFFLLRSIDATVRHVEAAHINVLKLPRTRSRAASRALTLLLAPVELMTQPAR